MRESVESKTLFVGLLVGLAHIGAGIAVFVEPSAIYTTPLAALHHTLSYFGFNKGILAAPLIFGAGVMAVLGANQGIRAPRGLRSLFFAPQQILLLFQLYTIMTATFWGVYPDGYIPVGGGWFIMADQMWAWILAVTHSIWLASFVYGGTVRELPRDA